MINKKEESKMSSRFVLRQRKRELYHALRGKLQEKDSEKGKDKVS